MPDLEVVLKETITRRIVPSKLSSEVLNSPKLPLKVLHQASLCVHLISRINLRSIYTHEVIKNFIFSVFLVNCEIKSSTDRVK